MNTQFPKKVRMQLRVVVKEVKQDLALGAGVIALTEIALDHFAVDVIAVRTITCSQILVNQHDLIADWL
jgi:hypothetical protein